MLHHNLSFELLVEFECNAYCDEHTRRGYCVVDTQISTYQLEESRRDNSYEAKEQRAEQNYSVVNLGEIVTRRLTASDTLYRSAVLLEISCYVLRVELYLSIEVCKEDNQTEHYEIVEYPAYPLPVAARSAGIAEGKVVVVVLRIRTCKLEYHQRNRHKGRCEDDGHNTRTVDLDRNEGRLSAVHFVALYLFSVVDFDSSLAAVYEYDERKQQKYDYDISDKVPDFGNVGLNLRNGVYQSQTERRQDTAEDYQGSTVADTEFGNSLTQPHYNRAACDEQSDEHQRSEPAFSFAEHRVEIILVCYDDTDCLYDSQTYSNESRDNGNLLTTFVTLLGQSLERRYDKCEQLHYDKAVDKRQNTEREQRQVLHRAAAHHTQKLKNLIVGTFSAAELRAVKVNGNSGERNPATYTESQKYSEGCKNSTSDAFIAKCVFNSLPH